jgi:hypothetical protein
MLMTRGSSNWRGGSVPVQQLQQNVHPLKLPRWKKWPSTRTLSFEDAINKLLWNFRLDSKFVSDRPERPALEGEKVPNRLSFRGQTMQNRKKNWLREEGFL